MPQVKIKIPSLYGGISQQPAHLRYPSQVEDADNTVFEVIDGASKRPGSHFIAEIEGLNPNGDYKMHKNVRDDKEQYLIIIGGANGSGTLTINVYELDGREATVEITPEAQEYLDENNPTAAKIKICSNADYTFILNTTVETAVTNQAPAGYEPPKDDNGNLIEGVVYSCPRASTMPVAMKRTQLPTEHAPAGFEVDLIDWYPRESGNNDTNPPPTILEKNLPIADIAFHRNRMVLAGGESLVFSQAGDYFNFFIEVHDNLADSDPIDVGLTSNQVTFIDYVLPYRETLMIFTKSGRQFELTATDLLTPSTAAITPTTQYETQDVRPIPIGTMIYFVGARADAGMLYEYHYDADQASNVARDLTAHVSEMLPGSIRSIKGSANNTTVMVVSNNTDVFEAIDLTTEDGRTLQTEDGKDIILDLGVRASNLLHMYRYHYKGAEKLQSAWGRYRFGEDYRIADVQSIENDCFMLVKIDNQFVIERLPIGRSKTPDEYMPMTIHLDQQVMLKGVWDGVHTTFTLPSTTLKPDSAVLGPDFAEAGKAIEIAELDGTTVKLAGNHTAGIIYFGRSYLMRIELTQPYYRDQNGVADIGGLLQIRSISTLHVRTSAYQVRSTMPNRDDRIQKFKAEHPERGEMQAWHNGDADDMRIYIENPTHKPCTISAIEFDADFHATEE